MVKSVSICAICGRIKNHPHGKIRVHPCAKNIRYIRAIRVQKNTIRMVNPLYLCYLWENLKIIRMVNSLDSRYYFPLVSGSSTNLVFKKNPCAKCYPFNPV